jgi:hypothetical protein
VTSIDVELVVPAVLGKRLILVWVLMMSHLLCIGDHDMTRHGQSLCRDALLTVARLEPLRQ